MSDDDPWPDFASVVNMTPRQLRDWLDTKESTETHWRYSLMNWGHDPKAD